MREWGFEASLAPNKNSLAMLIFRATRSVQG
jgi:hypothetical protein